jgi:hypothetical protein
MFVFLSLCNDVFLTSQLTVAPDGEGEHNDGAGGEFVITCKTNGTVVPLGQRRTKTAGNGRSVSQRM